MSNINLDESPKYKPFAYYDKPAGRDYYSIHAASASLLKKFLDWCPNKAINNVFTGSKATRDGTLIHALALEPETVHEEFIRLPPEPIKEPKKKKSKDDELVDDPFAFASADPIEPEEPQELISGHYYLFDGIRRGKAWEAQSDLAAANGVELISKSELALAKLAANEIRNNKVSRIYFDNPYLAEEEFFYDLKADNGEVINCKLKADLLVNLNGKLVIADIKSLEDASLDSISKTIDKYHYTLQSSAYLNGVTLNERQAKALQLPVGTRAESFVFIFIEKGRLPIVNVCETSQEMNLLGFLEYTKALDIYADCLKNGIFPGYTDQGQARLELNIWQKKKLNQLSCNIDPNDLPDMYKSVFIEVQKEQIEVLEELFDDEQVRLDTEDFEIDLESL